MIKMIMTTSTTTRGGGIVERIDKEATIYGTVIDLGGNRVRNDWFRRRVGLASRNR